MDYESFAPVGTFLAGVATMYCIHKLKWMRRKDNNNNNNNNKRGQQQKKKKGPTVEKWYFDTKKIVTSEDVFEEEDDDDDDSSSDEEGGDTTILDTWAISDYPFKMVLVVNQGLGMTKGKVAAQCAHATIGAYKKARANCRNVVRFWEHTGQAKVAVKAANDDELLEIQRRAKAFGLVTYKVRDAGRTQIAAGSQTVLAIGPAPVAAFLDVSDHLKLL